MQISADRRYPDEQFYFQGHELVVNQGSLVGEVPRAEVLLGSAVVGSVVGATGALRVQEMATRPQLRPGERLLSVVTANSFLISAPDAEGDFHTAETIGGPLGHYEVQEHDLLFLRYGQLDNRIVLASAPLEADVGENPAPLGIIDIDKNLITWGQRGQEAKQAIELAVATYLVRGAVDCYLIQQELRGRELLDVLRHSDPVDVYLRWHSERTGDRRYPPREPAALQEGYPPLDEATRRRYEPRTL